MKYDNLLWSAGACSRFGLRTLACTLFLPCIAAFATSLPAPETPTPPQKPIDQLISAAGIYKHDLAIMDLKTLEITPLTDDYTIEQDPTWSPDGKSILYSAIDDAWHELRLLNLETGEKKTLLAEDGVSFVDPKWNKENKLVIEKRTKSNRKWNLVLALADISLEGISNVVDTEVQGIQPSWGPESELFFTGTEATTRASTSLGMGGPARKYVIKHLNTKNNMQFVQTVDMDLPHYCSQPVFSDDAKKIAFRANTIGMGDIFVKTTKRMIRITDNVYDDSFPSWSPKSDEVFYASDRTGTYQIYKSDLKGIENRLTENNACEFVDPVSSPDGKSLLFKIVTYVAPVPLENPYAHIKEELPSSNLAKSWDYFQSPPFGISEKWRTNHQVGSVTVGLYGELLVLVNGNSGGGLLCASKVSEYLALASFQEFISYPYCTIVKDGTVSVDDKAVSYFNLPLAAKPVYPPWPVFENGAPALPKAPALILPTSVAILPPIPNLLGWALEVATGEWGGMPDSIPPSQHAILFFRAADGGLDIKRKINDDIVLIAYVATDRSMTRYFGGKAEPCLWPYLAGEDKLPMQIPPLMGYAPFVKHPLVISWKSGQQDFDTSDSSGEF